LLSNKVSFDLDGTPEVLVSLELSLQLRHLAQQQPSIQKQGLKLSCNRKYIDDVDCMKQQTIDC
jgi:hypothetical protein